ncbi:putative ammonium transporter 1 [Blattella germanica]|nr:putative ammonium transporter 1 [Blattella germanica]
MCSNYIIVLLSVVLGNSARTYRPKMGIVKRSLAEMAGTSNVIGNFTDGNNTALVELVLNMNKEMIDLKNGIDDVFIISNGIIVCLMQCGFACLEAGAVRSKNATNIIMKNIMDIFISSVAYWLVGYALAYGEGNAVIGYTHWAGIGIDYGKMAHWFFQCIFAATAATIVSGAVAERCNYIAYITYSAVISGIVYPPITHWVWTDEGWLNKLGYIDYSGCGPVHLLGGVCSFFGALFIGPRIGRFGNKYNHPDKEEIVGHSVPVSVCAGADNMAMWASFLSGAIVAPIYMGIHYGMLMMKVDDPLDAVAVHLGAGFWGLLSASLFGYGGIVYGVTNEAALRLWWRIVGAAIIILWGSIASCIMFGILKSCGKLRVTEEQELKGLDIAMHNEPGYPIQGWVAPPQFPPISQHSKKMEKAFRKSDLEIMIKPDMEISVSPTVPNINKIETEALLKAENETN